MEDPFVKKAVDEVKVFYKKNPQIQQSHGIDHALDVFRHACRALEECNQQSFLSWASANDNADLNNVTRAVPSDHDSSSIPTAVSNEEARDILIAALLHDVDDRKYFPDSHPHKNKESSAGRSDDDGTVLANAKAIMKAISLPNDEQALVAQMIGWVSGSKNGNDVPLYIQETRKFHLLIPRWSDRLEAMGARGAVRCYEYSCEIGQPLSTAASPRPETEAQVWRWACDPQRWRDYQRSGCRSSDMMSHYYDKLLRVSRPPREIVQNAYLERQARAGAALLVQVCLRFGKTGQVDEDYIRSLAAAITRQE